ncbi:MAG TPA: 5-(carboxyamino)imidazole ribonucleotide synthase [Burkholderiaceae bacterium]|nr:5-(carboxyamino)imidazole ribonucleotide synthase [Burkholderiaceae bacterium]
MIAPGRWLGMLGGGQLGRMFCYAAHVLGYRVAVLDPDQASPAGAVADRHIRAAYDDEAALDELAAQCEAITTEFENVPAPTLAFLAKTRLVAPNARPVGIAQDRIAEKRFVAGCGIDVAPHAVIQTEADLDQVDTRLLPGILKAARLGYDGKGQARVANRDEARAAFIAFGRVPCVLEQRLSLDYEISVVCARTVDGATAVFPVAENVHRDGILAVSRVPGPHTRPALAEQAAVHATDIATQLDYVGVLCVEFFVLTDGRLLVNEMAPRPHNSGHYTIDACVTDQFEQQVRALANLPLGATTLRGAAVMLNLLGDAWFDASGQLREPRWADVLALPGAKLHLYGKTEPRRGRKMGHLTCVGATPHEAEHIAAAAARALGVPL